MVLRVASIAETLLGGGSTGLDDITIPGLGWTPKAVMVTVSTAAADDVLTTQSRIGVGFCDGASEFAVSNFTRNDGTTTDTHRASSASSTIYFFNAGSPPAITYNASGVSGGAGPIPNGWRFNYSSSFTTPRRALFTFFGGDGDFTVGNTTLNGTSPNPVTGVGFQPKWGMFISDASPDTPPRDGTQSKLNMGAFHDGASLVQRALTQSARDNLGTSQNYSYQGTAESLYDATVVSGAKIFAGTVGGFNADGFSITPDADPNGDYVGYLVASDEGEVWLGDLDLPTTGSYNETGPGFQPNAALCFGADIINNDTNTSGVSGSISAFDGTREGAVIWTDEDDATTMNAQGELRTSGIGIRGNPANLLYDISGMTFTATGWTGTVNTFPATARKAYGFAFKETPAGPEPPVEGNPIVMLI